MLQMYFWYRGKKLAIKKLTHLSAEVDLAKVDHMPEMNEANILRDIDDHKHIVRYVDTLTIPKDAIYFSKLSYIKFTNSKMIYMIMIKLIFMSQNFSYGIY